MKRLFLILIILLFPFLLTANEERVYNVAVIKNWKPYYYVNENGKLSGYAVELFDELAKSIDLKYKYIIADNANELIKLFEEGKADIMPNIGITQRRENLFLFTQETDSFFVNIYKKKGMPYNSFEDLKEKKIGLVKANVCNKLLNKYSIHKIYFNNYESMINALKKGNIDALCFPKPLIEEKVSDSLIVPLDNAIKEIKRGIGVSKKEFNLLPRLNEAITKIKLNGEYKRIHDKWFGNNSYIQLSKKEAIFIIITFLGFSFTTLIIIFYILNKKRWLITKDILEEEIDKKTKILKVQNRRLKNIHRRLKEQSYIDGLTKIYNRKLYNEKINEFLSLYKRYDYKFSFLIFDIDDFKSINDTFGHIVGDKVLIELTKIVSGHIRADDYFFRVGGEEFIILLHTTTLEEAVEVAEKIREIIEKELTFLGNRKITVSIGVTEVSKDEKEESIYKRADNLLYRAKNSGKNRVCFK